jgi:anti-anti-sigma factor
MNGNHVEIVLTRGDATVLAVSGRVSVDSSPMLRDRLLTAVRSHEGRAVIVDLSSTSSVDCSGIATLIEALKIAHRRNVALQLTGLHGRLRNLFEITGVLSVFEASSLATSSLSSKES